MRDDIDLVIFDCDGVLVDSELLASQVLAEVIEDFGGHLKAEDCRDQFTGSSLSRVESILRDHHGLNIPKNFIEIVRAKDRDVFQRELKPISGIEHVLCALSLPKCVASSGSMEKITHSLDLTGLRQHLEPHLFSAQMVEQGKPAPDLFLHAAQTMGMSPDKCLVIEDSVVGIKAAKAAGMMAFGFVGGSHCNGNTSNDLLHAGADRTFDDMTSLTQMISQG